MWSAGRHVKQIKTFKASSVIGGQMVKTRYFIPISMTLRIHVTRDTKR